MRTEFLPAIAIALGCLFTSLAAPAAPSAAELEQAGNLFTITCSSSMCHGDGGVGARGPALRNRHLPADFIRNTMLQGRSGTPMPSFKDALTPQEINAIVGYVMSLSPGTHAEGDAEIGAMPVSTPAATLSEQALHGKELFLDENRPTFCGACHSAQERGGLVGPDLTTIGRKSARDIYAAMTHPAPGNPAFPVIEVTTRAGAKYSGIAADSDPGTIRLYDVSAIPPVLRSFYKSDGATAQTLDKTVLYAHTLADYSHQDVADLIAYLKAAGGDPVKTLSPKDLDLQ